MIMWVRFRLPMFHCIAHKASKVKLDFHPCAVDIGRASCMVIQEKGHAGMPSKRTCSAMSSMISLLNLQHVSEVPVREVILVFMP